MAHHIEARFDEEDNTFVPPLRTIGFNQNLTINDSLLVQSYIECYDISYPEALRRIEAEVAEIQSKLNVSRNKVMDIAVTNILTGLKNRYALMEELGKRMLALAGASKEVADALARASAEGGGGPAAGLPRRKTER